MKTSLIFAVAAGLVFALRTRSSPTRSRAGQRAAAIDMIAKKSVDVNVAEA